MRVSSTDGVELEVHDLGGDGPDLLLVHATGFHGRVWEPLAAHLDGFHRWSVDMRAHGDSTAPDDRPLEWDGFADDVLAVVDALGLDRPTAWATPRAAPRSCSPRSAAPAPSGRSTATSRS